MKSNLIFKGIVFMLLLATFACKKDNKILSDTSAKLKFSEDTIIFDTVFTSVGTITHTLKIYNTYKQTLKISSINLAGGKSSNFRLNIDGAKSITATDIEIAPNDSLYIFVAATIDPNNGTTPLIVTDSIVFDFNGKKQDVDLVAWGQNAHYIKGSSKFGSLKYALMAGANENVTLETDKPYVIYGYIAVDSLGTLNIPAGTKLHFHNKSGILVWRYGNLNIQGTQSNKVILQGDRLDYQYRDQPNQWDRILVFENSKITINYAKIINAFIGIQSDIFYLNDANIVESQIKITNTEIGNMSAVGMIARAFYVEGYNNLFYNTGGPACLIQGGLFNMRNSTFTSFYSYPARKDALVVLRDNYIDALGTKVIVPLEICDFDNCLVIGYLTDELDAKKCTDCNVNFNYRFTNSILKVNDGFDFNTTNFINSLKYSLDPTTESNLVFKDYLKNDFKLASGSIAIGKGDYNLIKDIPNETYDIDGKSKSNPPSAGCYEY